METTNYAELPGDDDNDLEGSVISLNEDESMVAMASRREVVSRTRRKYIWVTLVSAALILIPLAAGELCAVISNEPSWNDEASGTCAMWAWVFFVTFPLGIIILIVGWLILLCKGLRSI